MKKEIIVASKNPGKIKEYQNALRKLNINVKSMIDLDILDIEETASTFKENALLKAKSIYQILNLPILADDSGLIVKALPKELGIKSKRFSKSQNDDDNIDLLLFKLKNEIDRSAYFKTVICLYINPQDIRYYQGITKGVITVERRGNQGFGYDPVFLVDEIDKTYGELNLDEKEIVSHRGKAIQKLIEDLKDENINF